MFSFLLITQQRKSTMTTLWPVNFFIKHILEKVMYMYTCNWKEISLKLDTDFTSLEANVLIIPATCIIIERILKKNKINGWILHHMDDRCPILNNFIGVLLWLVLLEPYIILINFNQRFEAMRYLIKLIFLQWMVTFSDKNKAFYKHSNVEVLCFITLKRLWF